MSGHSKWANIKHKKARVDAKKGKVFSRIAKEIIVAVKQGGSDYRSNASLRLVLQKARASNMPSDNIDRNIKKASSADQKDYMDMTYELYGYGGVGILVEILTDNRNRIASEMRIATNKRGGTIATPGSVSFNFDRKGVLHVNNVDVNADELFMSATDAGAEDFEDIEGDFIVTTAGDELYSIKEKLEGMGYKIESAALEMMPKSEVECDDSMRSKNEALIDWIEEIDDVDDVYHNMK